MLPGECIEPAAPTAITSTMAFATLLTLATLGVMAGVCVTGALSNSVSCACIVFTDMLEFSADAVAVSGFGSPAGTEGSGGVALELFRGQLSTALLHLLKELVAAGALSICGEALSNLCASDCGCCRNAYCGCG